MRRLQGKKINKDIADTATEPESSPTETDFHKSDTPTRAPAMPRSRRSGTGLSAKVLPELQKMARDLGISGAGRMRKSQLIYAIQEKRAALQETQTEDTS
jgi:transcription termination factor Rho